MNSEDFMADYAARLALSGAVSTPDPPSDPIAGVLRAAAMWHELGLTAQAEGAVALAFHLAEDHRWPTTQH